MSQKQDKKDEADRVVRNIKRQTRRKFNAEEKIRIVLAGLCGEDSIAELCRREGSTSEVRDLRRENADLKEALGKRCWKSVYLKKHDRGWGDGIRRRYMRYSASSKYEIIRTVEESSLGIGRTLDQLGILKSTFYNCMIVI